MSFRKAALIASLWLLASLSSWNTAASAAVISFEGLPDSTSLTTQIVGLTFTNSTVVTAGITLNEFEFPPRSGVNVLIDDGGAIGITFDVLQGTVGGFFTYSTPLTLAAFDALHHPVATAHSAFGNNEALSGEPGSSPNELLSVVFGGIQLVTITGDLAGISFALDDLTFTPVNGGPVPSVPEPSTLVMLIAPLVTVLVWRALKWSIHRRGRAEMAVAAW